MIRRTYQERAVRKAKRLEKRELLGLGSKAKHKKLPSHSRCEKRYWDAFAKYIRERDKLVGCFSCYLGKAETAGHVISRRKRATKYDEMNVLGQCYKCNYMDKHVPGYHDVCVAAYIHKYGPAIYSGLVLKSQEFCKRPSRQECLERATFYKAKFNNIMMAQS